jgi:biotin carboxyl carrier protein
VELEAEVAGRRLRVSVNRENGRYRVRVGERVLELDLDPRRPHFPSLLLGSTSREPGIARTAAGRYDVSLRGGAFTVRLTDALPGGAAEARTPRAAGPERVTAPMPGRIVKLLVELGQVVEAGQGLMVMEAMKMENELRAPRGGTLEQIGVREGEVVETGALLALLA